MIEKAIQSVVTQPHSNLEHIIIDGGSTDDTLKRLSRYSHLRIVSEPDRGLYDAYNKGMKLASGDVVGFLNDDDYYAERILDKVADAFRARVRPQIVSGWAAGERKTTEGEWEPFTKIRELPSERLSLMTMNLDPNEVIMNARFFATELLQEVGTFDTRYRIGADWDFMLRVAMRSPRIIHIPEVVWRYREHDEQISLRDNLETSVEALQECLAILESLLGSSRSNVSNRRTLRRLHSSMALSGMGLMAYHRGGGAGAYALRGLRYDPLFLGRLGSRLISRRVPSGD